MNRRSTFFGILILLLPQIVLAGTLKSFSGTVKSLDKKRGVVVIRSVYGEERKFAYLPSISGSDSLAVDAKVSAFYDSESKAIKRFVTNSSAPSTPASSGAQTSKRSGSKPLSNSSRKLADNLSASNVEMFARRSSSARDAVLLYQAVIANPSTPKEEQDKLAVSMQKWQQDAEQDLQRVGNEWLSKDIAVQRRKDAEKLVDNALTVLDASSCDVALDRLKDATKIDPDNPNIWCWEGLLLAIVKRDFKKAAASFEDGLKVAPKDPSLLNNLALCEIRLRKFPDAVDHWTSALLLSPSSKHISQNVGRFIKLANNKSIKMFRGVDERTLKDALKVYADAKSGGDEADVNKGFFYVFPTARSSDDGKASSPSNGQSDLVFGYASGFVVAPEIIATNFHVVDGAAGFLISSTEAGEKGKIAQVLLTDADRDLAIIRCPGLTLKPLPLSTDLGRGKQIAVFGFPEPDILGNTLKMTEGIITSLPDASTQNNFLHSAIANHGNSGGPICDLNGSVVGILDAGYNTIDLPICSGVPSSDLIQLLKKQGVSYQSAATPAAKSLEELDKATSKSVVQIKILGSPEDKSVAARLALEDDTCLMCDGAGQVSCPNKKCLRGIILVDKTAIIGRTVDGALTQTQSVQQKCPDCGGVGKVDCPICHGK